MTVPLYELTRNQYIEVPISETEWEIVWFGHVDGMYSYCITKDGELTHLRAWTKARPIDRKDVPQEIINNVENSKWYES